MFRFSYFAKDARSWIDRGPGIEVTISGSIALGMTWEFYGLGCPVTEQVRIKLRERFGRLSPRKIECFCATH